MIYEARLGGGERLPHLESMRKPVVKTVNLKVRKHATHAFVAGHSVDECWA